MDIFESFVGSFEKVERSFTSIEFFSKFDEFRVISDGAHKFFEFLITILKFFGFTLHIFLYKGAGYNWLKVEITCLEFNPFIHE
jgi:hypothetical protein